MEKVDGHKIRCWQILYTQSHPPISLVILYFRKKKYRKKLVRNVMDFQAKLNTMWINLSTNSILKKSCFDVTWTLFSFFQIISNNYSVYSSNYRHSRAKSFFGTFKNIYHNRAYAFRLPTRWSNLPSPQPPQPPNPSSNFY